MLKLKSFDKIASRQKDFMHSLSDKVLFRYYDSQSPTHGTGNLEGWAVVVLAFLNLGVRTNPKMLHVKDSLRRFSPAHTHGKILDSYRIYSTHPLQNNSGLSYTKLYFYLSQCWNSSSVQQVVQGPNSFSVTLPTSTWFKITCYHYNAQSAGQRKTWHMNSLSL